MSLLVDACDVSGGELSNAESSDSSEGQHVSIKLLHHNVGSSTHLYSKRTVQKPTKKCFSKFTNCTCT